MSEQDARIERETVLRLPIEEAWRLVSDADELSEWLAPEVELEPWEGGEIAVRHADGCEQRGTVETVDGPHRIAFRWLDPRHEVETQVEIRLDEHPLGTRLRVVEREAVPVATASAIGFARALVG